MQGNKLKMDTKVQYVSALKSPRLSIADYDEKRQENSAYEYLCHLEEARLWMEGCINEDLPHSTELEARLRNGVYFAKLGHYIAPHVVPSKKIFDIDQKIYNTSGLHYRHTDNINHWISAMKAVGLPSYFYPNSFDVYGKKNMPKAVYCLHVLNIYLHRCGKGMKIIDLLGKIQFNYDEITAVSKDFKEYGIQLPAFNKIGVILANEISPNDAIIHAAIIAINIAICNPNSEHLYAALMNPNAQFKNVIKGYAKSYQKALSMIKSKRASEVKSETHKTQLCWEFLTQTVIQEEIDAVNMMTVLNELKSAIVLHNVNDFITTLKSPLLCISDIILENADVYISTFKEALKVSEKNIEDQSSIQSIIDIVNYNEHKIHETNSAILTLNDILAGDEYFETFNVLKSLTPEITLHDFGRQFYHLQLQHLKKAKGRPLSFDDLQDNLPKFTALLDISMAIIQKSEDDTFKALSNPVIKCWELYENLKRYYFISLNELKFEKNDSFLSIEQIKKCIMDVNTVLKLQQNEEISTKNINFALTSNDITLLMNSILQDPTFLSIDTKHEALYFNLLSDYKLNKTNHDLSRHEIQSQINIANKIVLEAEYFCACLASVNMAVDNKDMDALFDSLKILHEDIELCSGCKKNYIDILSFEKEKKLEQCSLDSDISNFSWIKWEVNSQISFYLNIKTLESTWNMKERLYSVFLTKSEIFNVVMQIKNECQCLKYEILKSCVTYLQSYIRGFLVRRNFSAHRINLSRNYLPVHNEAALKLQAFMRMSVIRKKYLLQKTEKMRLHNAARIIQRQWRAFKVHKNLTLLAHSSNPPLLLMQKIIYMLEISNDDYSEEFKLQTIKGKAVQTIRYNQKLLKEIDEMDIKIGLLIRNRITLEDLLIQKKKTNSKVKKKDISVADIKSRGFKLFSKKYNALIESYEKLLYLLQTRPEYLSRLIVSLPSNQATTFIESIIFSLYNYGSTPREEYLLLKMLCMTLNEEINLRGEDLSDIIKGENIIMKIIISFYRKSYWRDCLKNLLEPLVSEVLKDKCVLCSMDPIEIYKVWQNELEVQTGKKSTLSHDITVDDALSHLEVDIRFNLVLESLLKYSLNFCDVIVNGQELIPYGIMYVCKFLKMSLQKKYSASSTTELNKIIGNFLYYRYINPAIIAPDVFDIITNTHTNQVEDYERMKLSAIAKFLHFAVTGKKYAENMPHLMCLNPYLSDCHERFMSFFDEICNVKFLEEHFNIDIFSEAIVQTPEVYMSFKELQTLYTLLSEKEYDIAPDSNDILHEICEDFNPNSFNDICGSSEEFLNTEVCLSLKNEYDLDVEDESNEEKTFVETKFMLITLLQVYLDVNSIVDLFEREATAEEELQFEKIFFMKQRDADFSKNWIRKSRDWKTLPALQSALQFNLNFLELKGYVSSTNSYQDILNSIAKDIVNRWRYRISRKKEIIKLTEVQKQLDSKTLFYLEKLDYYNKYIAVCLENMKVSKRNSKIFICRNPSPHELQSKKTIKCSGSKLYEKGILIEIKDLDTCQLKNVNFEISPSEDLGIFVIKAKFMGVPLETVDIDIQELLCMQYQGISEMNVFDCVKINNNLLLHFLNSKFYGKHVS